MKNAWEKLFALALLLCAGTVLAACSDRAPGQSGDTEPLPVIESFDSFEAYTKALAALLQDYGLGDEAALAGGGEADYSDPYLSRRILISTGDELAAWPGAARILHYGNDYVLQFRTVEETREAYEALKQSPLGDAVSLDGILSTHDGQE